MKRILLCLLTLVFYVHLLAQTRTVTGKVTDPDGKPVPYATVTVKGSATRVSADENGNFSIQADPNTTLVFTASGYTASETNIGTQTSIIGALGRQAALSEVVVVALGQTRSKDKLGYATSSFKSEDINRSAPVSPLDGLQGRVAGAEISTIGGQPGSSTKIILRGYSSFSTAATSENQ